MATYDVREITSVKCSCGRETTLSPNGTKYVSLEAGWKFRTSAEADEYERNSGKHIKAGWYCGQPDHERQMP